MNARDRNVSTEAGNALDAEGPLRRWARRRREVAREEQAAAEVRRGKVPRELPEESPQGAPSKPLRESPEVRDSDAGASEPAALAAAAAEPAAEAEKVLTDEDMPPLDTLDENSDYSSFLSPGVTEGLRRRALRKLFLSAAFNVRDGLDDYDDDFTSFEALGDIVTSDMKHQAEMEAERAKQAQAEAEPASGLPDESSGDEGARLASADGEAAGTEEEGPAGAEARSSASEPAAASEEASRSSRLADGGTPNAPVGESASIGADAPGDPDVSDPART